MRTPRITRIAVSILLLAAAIGSQATTASAVYQPQPLPADTPTIGISLAAAEYYSWRLSITSAFAAANCRPECTGKLEAFYVNDDADVDDNNVEVPGADLGWFADVGGSNTTYLKSTSLSSDLSISVDPAYTHLRALVYGKDATGAATTSYGAWIRVDDPIPNETPFFAIDSIDRHYLNSTVGTSALYIFNRLCWQGCTTVIWGYSNSYREPRQVGSFSGLSGRVFLSDGFYGYTRFWATITPQDPAGPSPYTTNVVAVDKYDFNVNIVNNVDLAAAALLVASRGITPEELCFPLNSLHTPLDSGSITAAFDGCDMTARASGTAAALRYVATTYGAPFMAVILAGTYALPLAPDQTAPPQPEASPADDPQEPPVWAGSPEQDMQRIAEGFRLRVNKTRPVPDELVDNVTKTCYDNAIKAGLAPSECANLPIFLPGREFSEAAQHDAEAILGYPKWFALTRGTSPTAPENWYHSYPPCVKPYSGHCDEYPFKSALEGGDVDPAIGKPRASLKLIDPDDNTLEGSYLSGFFSNCRVAPNGGRYLVLPLVAPSPAAPVVSGPTSRICKRSY